MGSLSASIFAIIILTAFALVIWLQIHLSKKQNKWLGLILPTILFCISMIAVLGLFVFSTQTSTATSTAEIGSNSQEVIIQDIRIEQGIDYLSTSLLFVNILILIINLNIPTLILLAIYFFTRKSLLINQA